MGATMKTGHGSTHEIQGSPEIPLGRLPVWVRYALAVLMLALMIVALVQLRTVFPAISFRIAFIFLAMLVTFLLGLGPGVFSAVLSLLAYDCLYVPPRGIFVISGISADDWAGIVILVVGLTAGIWGVHGMRELTGRLRAEVREHKEAEEELRRQQGVLSTVLNTVPVGVVLTDEEGRFTYASPSLLEILGGPPSGTAVGPEPGSYELRYPSDGSLIPPEDLTLMQALRTGECSREEEVLIHRADGSEVTVLSVACPVKDSEGRVTGAVASLTDITERKRAEEALAAERERLRLVIDTLPMGVFISDAEGNILARNEQALKMWGTESPLAGIEPLGGPYKAWWADTGKPIGAEEWTLARALSRGETSVGNVVDIERPDGTRITVLNSAVPLRDRESRITGAVLVIQDITELERLRRELARDRERLAALYGIAEIGLTARSLKDALETLASRMREVMHAHSCSIFTYDPDTREFVGRAACNIGGLVGTRLPVTGGVAGIVYHEQRPVYVSDAENDPLVRDTSEKQEGIRALLSVPLIARGRLIGMARVDETREREFTQDEIAVFEAMADRAATIIDNAELVETLSTNYGMLQRALLPPTPPVIPGYRIAATYRPGVKGAEIGGDFYDILVTEDGHLGVEIGDVTGKGIPSASLASDTRSTLRAFLYDTSEPGTALSHTNSVICNELQDVSMFVTVFAAVIEKDTARVRYANAGHPPAAIWHRDTGQVEFAHYGDPPVGLMSVTRFSEQSLALSPGDKVIFCTDGVSEARNSGEMFGLDRVEEVILAHGGESPEELVSAVVETASSWAHGRLADDAAVIVIECGPLA